MRTEELDKFEEILQEGLVKLCSGAGLLGGEILESEDLEAKWNEYITDYVSDAVKNIEEYPQPALAWAAFLGMGVAWNWDHDWIVGSRLPYQAYYGKEGWDDMDENVMFEILGITKDSPEMEKLVSTLISCADATIALIQHNDIPLDTEFGFYILVRSYTVLFRIGASIALYKFGYKKVPVKFS